MKRIAPATAVLAALALPVPASADDGLTYQDLATNVVVASNFSIAVVNKPK